MKNTPTHNQEKNDSVCELKDLENVDDETIPEDVSFFSKILA